MHYALTHHGTPDITALQDAIAELDPAAIVDFDAEASHVRISSFATDAELTDCLRKAGIPVAMDGLIRLPSQCCGGCGG